MPNWCGNTLTITHTDPVMIKRAYEAFARSEFLNEFIPVPKDLADTVSGSYADADAQAALQAQEQANIEKHGYKTWYDFCVNEWGTKWDVGDGQGIQTWDDHELVVYFDSAWAPPIAAYEKLMDLGFTVYATYYEPGCAFAGIYEDGTDSCYDLAGMNSSEVRNDIPEELDDAFCISESMAEYEAENEDEVTAWYKDGVEETGLTPHKVTKEDV